MTYLLDDNIYLLDTNIISALMRQPQGIVAQHIARIGEDHVYLSIIAAAELRYGIEKKASEGLAFRLQQIMHVIQIIPFDGKMDITYAQIRARLEREGQIIGANDLLIAAQALHLNATLVTDNEREFRRIEGLRVENWLRETAEK